MRHLRTVLTLATCLLFACSPATPAPQRVGSFLTPGGGGASLLPTITPAAPPAASAFSWVNQRGGTKSTNADGSLLLSVPFGAGVNRTLITLPIPSVPPYDLIVGMMLDAPLDAGVQDVGLAITDGTKIYSVVYEGDITGGLSKFFVQTFTSPTVFAANLYNNSNYPYYVGVRPIFFRIQDDTANLVFSVSNTGRQWIVLQSDLSGAFLTPTAWGPIVQSTAGTMQAQVIHLAHTP